MPHFDADPLIVAPPCVIMRVMDEGTFTIPAFLAATVARRGGEPALGFICAGELHWRTWREVADAAGRLAEEMRAAGVGPGDRVAHVSENRYEWVIADLAMHVAGAVHVPIHVTLSGQQIAEQVADCGAKLVFEKGVRTLLCEAPSGPFRQKSPDPFFATDDLATILYTSGTTGRPRGVMLSQRNLASNAAAVVEAHGGDSDQTRLCVLPLSHIYARTCDLYAWVYRGSRLVLAENRGTLLRDLQLAQPTALSAVPYIYQRIAEQVRASHCADEAGALCQFFGGRMERLSCGGAPLAPDVEAWYADCGLPIACGYGLTEASPVVSMSSLTSRRMGSVGRPMGGVEVRLADDGEVLVRGPNVMLGYWQDAAATAEAVRDGWLHTGDLGELDADGFLSIRGRKKELIVLSTGKNIVPTRVEGMLTASPLIEQAAVFGDGMSALVALIVPSAAHHGGSETCSSALDDPPTRQRYIEEINRCLSSAAREEQVRDFVLLPRPFTIERGELTPKLSLCRSVIARNFAAELKTMLDSSQPRAAKRQNDWTTE